MLTKFVGGVLDGKELDLIPEVISVHQALDGTSMKEVDGYGIVVKKDHDVYRRNGEVFEYQTTVLVN